MGHHLPSVPEGDRLYPQPQIGDHQEGAWPCYPSTEAESTLWKSKEETQVQGQSSRILEPGSRRSLSRSSPAGQVIPLPSSSSSVQPNGTANVGRGRNLSNLLGNDEDDLLSGCFRPGPQPADQIRKRNWELDDKFPKSLSAWVEGMLKCLRQSRTGFGFYVFSSIRSCRGRRFASSTALFPIPMPEDAAWSSRPVSLGKNRRERLAVERAVRLIIAALNFGYLSAPFSCLEGLRRRPNSIHLKVYDRMAALVRAGGPTGDFSSLGCGRKSHQLDARLNELLGALQSLAPPGQPAYTSGGLRTDVPLVNDRDELVPYRCVDPSRLKLTGKGNWDCVEFLSDLFYLPFEPKCNVFNVLPPSDVMPDLSNVKVADVIGLCKVWFGMQTPFLGSFRPNLDHRLKLAFARSSTTGKTTALTDR